MIIFMIHILLKILAPFFVLVLNECIEILVIFAIFIAVFVLLLSAIKVKVHRNVMATVKKGISKVIEMLFKIVVMILKYLVLKVFRISKKAYLYFQTLLRQKIEKNWIADAISAMIAIIIAVVII